MTRIEVCCGVGGTGKTTTAAAMAVSHAQRGARVVVLTIDPARRLADALGVDGLDNRPRPVPLVDTPGRLAALMLDRKGTWDEVIRRHARPATAQRLLDNRYYQAVSTRLSGSHEYMAVEKLHDLVSGGAYDVVVLDTPPTQHVVDFFQAPDRVRSILDRSVMGQLLEPSGLGGAASRGALGIVTRLAGDGVMADIREFFHLFAELSAGFRQRSARIAEHLASDETAYWLVANADAPERNDLLGFLGEIRDRGMTFAGFLVNRVQPSPEGPFPTPDALAAAGGELDAWPEMALALGRLPAVATARAARHRRGIAALTTAADGALAWLVPEIDGGVRSLDGLSALARFLPPVASPYDSR